MQDKIVIHGARAHNLKNIDVDEGYARKRRENIDRTEVTVGDAPLFATPKIH